MPDVNTILVHGRVTIIFVRNVCLSVCAEFFSAIFDPISMNLGHNLVPLQRLRDSVTLISTFVCYMSGSSCVP